MPKESLINLMLDHGHHGGTKRSGKKIESVGRLKNILDDYGLNLLQFCLHFNLNHFGIDTSLVGLKTANDLVEITSNLQKNIPEFTMREVLERWNN